MSEGWGRDYSPPRQKSGVRPWLLAGVFAAVAALAVVGPMLNDSAPRRQPAAPTTDGAVGNDDIPFEEMPIDGMAAEDIEILPRHSATLDDQGFAATASVGDWDVAVLETDRHATEDWTAEQMDVGFDAAFVMTTVYVKNNGDAPADFTEALGFTFGNPLGSSIGYDPWDDWCPAWRDSALGVGVMLPGEARAVRVCVPVFAGDAAGLDMYVEANPRYLTGPSRTFGLPPDGVVLTAPRDVSANSAYAVVAASAAASGEWQGHTYTPQRAWVVSSDTSAAGEGTVRVAATFAVERLPSATQGVTHKPELRAPSGRVYWAGRCDSEEAPFVLDPEATEFQVCWDLLASDAHDLVAVFADAWGTSDWLALRIPETAAG